jgi:hypothetical protein
MSKSVGIAHCQRRECCRYAERPEVPLAHCRNQNCHPGKNGTT